MTEQEKKIFDMQCDATKALLLAQAKRDPSEDKKYINSIRFTPVALEAQCVKEDGSVDLNVRAISKEEYDLHQDMRYKAGERLATLRNEPLVSTLTEQKKEKAADSFLGKFSIETIKNKFRNVMKDLFKPSYAEIVANSIKKVDEDGK